MSVSLRSLPSSSFAFATCQVGAERALKAEVERVLHLRPAFMRPGLVTFKAESPVAPLTAVPLVFARAFGVSVDRGDDAHVTTRVLELASTHGPARLHVWERDRHAPGDAPRADATTEAPLHAHADALRARLLAAVPNALRADPQAELGDLVIDVVGVDPGLWLVGLHIHGPAVSAFPGGDPRLHIPADAPSKAWAKIEQGLLLGDVRLLPGDRVVEVGASPGGVSLALLRRGCEVIAIDPGEMDPLVLSSPHLTHRRAPVAEVDPASLPRPIHALVLDVNISPFAALRQIEGLARAHADTLCALLLTLKLGDWHMAARVPHLLSLVKKLGAPIAEIHARQLPANKVEIFVAALTPAGVARRAFARIRPPMIQATEQHGPRRQTSR